MNRNDQNSKTDMFANGKVSNIGSDKASNTEASGKVASGREPQQGADAVKASQQDTLRVDSRSDGSSKR